MNTTWRKSSSEYTSEVTVVEGCCLPSGLCGHLDPKLGCHTFATRQWRKTFYCDGRAEPNPPEYFQCSDPGDACTTTQDCCDDPGGNYDGAECQQDGTCGDYTG